MGRFFRALWTWFKARPWYVRVPLGAVVVLFALALLYTLARTLQYSSYGGVSLSVFVPNNADIEIYAPRLSDQLDRLQSQKDLSAKIKQLQKDKAARDQLDGLFQALGLPSFNDMMKEDNEAMLRRFCGRELVATVRFRDSGSMEFLVVTRLGFGDFLLLPAVDWFVEKVSKAGQTFLKQGDTLIAFYGPIAVISNSETMIVEALRRKGTAKLAASGIASLKINFQARAAAMASLRDWTGWSVLWGLQVQRARQLHANLDATDQGILTCDAEIEGVVSTGLVNVADPQSLLRLAPEDCSAALIAASRPDSLWEWLKKTALAMPANHVVGKDLRELVKSIQTHDGERRIVMQATEGYALFVASQPGRTDDHRDKGPFTTACAVIPSAHARNIYEAVDEICKSLFSSNQSTLLQAVSHRGVEIRYLTPDISSYKELMQPCYAIYQDKVLISNDLVIMKSVINLVSGNSSGELASSKLYKQAAARLNKLGFKNYFGSNATSGFLNLPRLKDSLRGNLTLMAALSPPKLQEAVQRARIRQRELSAGRAATERDVEMIYKEERAREVEELTAETLKSQAILDHIPWMAYEVTPGEPTHLKLAIGIK